MANTTRVQIPAEVSAFYDRTLLTRAVALFTHGKFAQVRDVPRNAGSSTIKFRRYGNLDAATTALSEGITPTGKQLSVTDVTATVAQYGDYVTVTDVLTYESADATLTEVAGDVLGDQAADTLDQLTRDEIAGGTQVYYGGNATSRVTVDSTDKIDDASLKKAVRLLKNGKAKPITRMVNPDTGYATTPINACYVAFVHPNTTYDLMGVSGFVEVEKYANKAQVMEGEVGKFDRIRFIETTNAKVFTAAGASGIDVYATVILGKDAYGISRVSGEAMRNIVKPLGSAGSGDPLDQRATSGWKSTFVAKRLNEAFMVRVEHAVSS